MKWYEPIQLLVFLQAIPEGYIVLDTQLIIGGKNAQMQIGIDDYCLAASSDCTQRLVGHLLSS
jgi:hypothetical protein